MKSYSIWSEIACGFRLFVFLSAILSLTSNAFGGSGQITPNPSTLNFGPISVGTSQSQPVTLTNSGGSKATITQVTLSGTGFTFSGLNYPVTLAGGQSVTGQVTFIPQSTGTDSGMVSISYSSQNGNKHNNALSASNTVTLPLSGTATTTTSGQLTANPPSLSFPNVTTGSSTTLPETLTNSGGSAVTISQITPSAGFSFKGITLPLTLSATQSVTFNVLFAPQSAGSVTGSVVISSNASNPTLTVTSTGTGTLPGTLAVAPTTYNFPVSVTVGTTLSQSSTLTASNAPVTVSSLGVSGSQFSVTGITLPVTIAAGNSVPFQVIFAPKTSGTASANVSFASNASNSPAVEVVSGTGTSPQHSVALGWNTSTSSGVVGYNIYRGTVSGGPYTRINSAVDTAPYDTDTTVQAGQTYYYVVTALDSAGAESSYSSQAQAVIPTP